MWKKNVIYPFSGSFCLPNCPSLQSPSWGFLWHKLWGLIFSFKSYIIWLNFPFIFLAKRLFLLLWYYIFIQTEHPYEAKFGPQTHSTPFSTCWMLGWCPYLAFQWHCFNVELFFRLFCRRTRGKHCCLINILEAPRERWLSSTGTSAPL